MQWIKAQLEPKCSEKSKPVWLCQSVCERGWYERMVWFGIHIHLLPEQARIPLQVMAVYNIKEQEK